MDEEHVKAIGNYEIVEAIRQAPEGTLYKAVEKNTGSPIILKIYYPSLKWSEESLNEFFNLTGHLRFIEHPYLLPIIDVGKHQNLPYVAFSSETFTFLSDQQSNQTGQKETLDFFHRIADALDYLHKQEILHGSLSPENIIIDADGNPKLFDHGLSGVFKKLLLENLEDGFDNLSISNLKCTSPEQILGRNPTRASDIYSFGTVFFFHAFGEYPFVGKFDPETALAHLDQRILKIEKAPSGASRHTLTFIEKCLQFEAEVRFTSFAQILEILERMKTGRKPRFQSEKRIVVKKRPMQQAMWLVIAVLGVAVIFSGYYYFGKSNPPLVVASIEAGINQPAPPIQATQSGMPQAPSQNDAPPPEGISTEHILTGASNQPAFEGEKPDLPTEKISVSNINAIREFSRLGYGRPEDVDVSPDETYVAFATSAGVFIFQNSQFLKWIDPQDWATSVQFSSDSTKLAIGVDSGDIQMWDWRGGERLYSLVGHTKKVNRILFASNDVQLYSASADQHVIVWNLRSREVFQDIPAHSSPVNDIAVSSDGRILISGSNDQLIRFWDVNSGKKVHEFSFEYGRVQAIAISSDDQYLAAGGGAGIVQQWRWDAGDYKNIQKRNDPIPVTERVWSLQYIRNDSELLVGMDGGKSRSYTAGQSKYEGVSRNFTVASLPSRWTDIFGAGFEFDSYSVVYGGNNVISINWDGKLTNQQTVILKPIYDSLDRLDFSEDGTILATGGNYGTTSVWDLRTNQILYKDRVTLPVGDPISLDGSSIAVIVPNTIRISPVTGIPLNEDNYQLVFLQNGNVLRSFTKTVPGGTVSYAHDGTVFVSSSLNEPKTWDYSTGYESFFGTRTDKGCRITFSANNNEVLQVISASGAFPTWGEGAGNLCIRSAQYGNSISAFSSELNLIAYINSNGLLEGFDTVQNQSLWNFKPDGKITTLAVSPDGSLVAYGNETGSMIFVNGRTGGYLTQITGNFGILQAIEFSEDGTKIATAGKDGTARLFGILE